MHRLLQPEVFAPVAGSAMRAPPMRAPLPQRRVSIADFFSPPTHRGTGSAVHCLGASTGRKRASFLAPTSVSAERNAEAADELEDAAVAFPPSTVKRARTNKGACFAHAGRLAAFGALTLASQRLPCATQLRACCTASLAAPSPRLCAVARFPSTPMRPREAHLRAARRARCRRSRRRPSRTPWPGEHLAHHARCGGRCSRSGICRNGWRKPPRSSRSRARPRLGWLRAFSPPRRLLLSPSTSPSLHPRRFPP